MKLTPATLGFTAFSLLATTGCESFEAAEYNENVFVSPDWLKTRQCKDMPAQQQDSALRLFRRSNGSVEAKYVREENEGDHLPTAQDLYRFEINQVAIGAQWTFCYDRHHSSSNGFVAYTFQTFQSDRYLTFNPNNILSPNRQVFLEALLKVQRENSEFREKHSDRKVQYIFGILGAGIALAVGIGRVVEARRRNMIEMAKSGTFNREDWEGWLQWILPERFYKALEEMNTKALLSATVSSVLADDHH